MTKIKIEKPVLTGTSESSKKFKKSWMETVALYPKKSKEEVLEELQKKLESYLTQNKIKAFMAFEAYQVAIESIGYAQMSSIGAQIDLSVLFEHADRFLRLRLDE